MIGSVAGYGTNSYYDYSSPFSNGSGRETAFVDERLEDLKNVGLPGHDKVTGEEECQTCKNRKYQDGSNEMVSFKSPAHISPGAAPAAVRAHEGEHVSNAYTKAAQQGGKVLRASVSIHTAICPECGRTYVSGGTTNTVISTPKNPDNNNPYQQNRNALNGMKGIGNFMDMGV